MQALSASGSNSLVDYLSIWRISRILGDWDETTNDNDWHNITLLFNEDYSFRLPTIDLYRASFERTADEADE